MDQIGDQALSKRVARIIIGLGGAVATMGLTVLAAWCTGKVGLIQVVPGTTPMAPTTALSLIALGASILTIGYGGRQMGAWLATSAGVIAALTLADYASGGAMGTSSLLDFLARAPLPRRMAPNTAVCLTLLAIAVLLMSRRSDLRGRAASLGLLASAATAMAFTSLAGYLTGLKTFAWGPFMPMAPHSALGLTLLGTAVLVFSWSDGRRESGPPSWLFLSATLAGAVISSSLWLAVSANTRVNAENAIAADLSLVKSNLAAAMELRTAVLARSPGRWEFKGEPSREDWEFEARLLFHDILDYQAIAWVDPSLRVRLVAPLKGNERLLHAYLGFEQRRHTAFAAARAERRPVVTRTVELLTGGRGFSIYAPVYQASAFRGFLVATFRVDHILPKLVEPAVARGEQISIFDGDQVIYSRSAKDDKHQSEWVQEETIDVQGASWKVKIWPTAAKLAGLRSSTPEVVLGAGLLLSFLLGTAVFQAQQAWARTRIAEAMRRALEREAAHRQQAELELDQFFTLSVEMLCIIGFDGCFKRLNPAWEKTLGVPLGDLQGARYLEFVHPEDRQQTIAAAERIAGGAPLSAFENRYRTSDGSYRWIQWACAPAADQPVMFAAARDVTAQRAAEDALRQAHDELEDRVRERTAALTAANQELEAFTYSVSHDLRAPLRHIDGFSKILLEDYGAQLPEGAKPLLDRVRQGTQRMGRMVDELLELSRTARRDPVKQATGLRSLVDEVIGELESEAVGREVEWRVQELPFADCDPALVRQVFVNLLGNALKFTRPRKQAVIEVGQVENDGEPTLFVRDNGVGFSMKYADKLFGAFQRLHRQEDFEGTGVGLATVHRIIAKHGGRIWAEAELDKGTTFYFTLGRSAGAPADSCAEHAKILEVHDVTTRS